MRGFLVEGGAGGGGLRDEDAGLLDFVSCAWTTIRPAKASTDSKMLQEKKKEANLKDESNQLAHRKDRS